MTWAYITIGVLMVVAAAAVALVVLMRDRLVDMRMDMDRLRNRNVELEAAEEARRDAESVDRAVAVSQELSRREISRGHGVAVDDDPRPGDDVIGAAPLTHIERWALRSIERSLNS